MLNIWTGLDWTRPVLHWTGPACLFCAELSKGNSEISSNRKEQRKLSLQLIIQKSSSVSCDRNEPTATAAETRWMKDIEETHLAAAVMMDPRRTNLSFSLMFVLDSTLNRIDFPLWQNKAGIILSFLINRSPEETKTQTELELLTSVVCVAAGWMELQPQLKTHETATVPCGAESFSDRNTVFNY